MEELEDRIFQLECIVAQLRAELREHFPREREDPILRELHARTAKAEQRHGFRKTSQVDSRVKFITPA